MKKAILRLALVVCLLCLTTFFVMPAAADRTVSIGLNPTEVHRGQRVQEPDMALVANHQEAQNDEAA